MISAILSHSETTVFPVFALIIFFSWFVLTLLWVFRKGSGALYARMSRLAFCDGEQDQGTIKQGERV